MALPAGSFGQVVEDQRTEAERWLMLLVPIGVLVGYIFWSTQVKARSDPGVNGLRGLGNCGHCGSNYGPGCGPYG